MTAPTLSVAIQQVLTRFMETRGRRGSAAAFSQVLRKGSDADSSLARGGGMLPADIAGAGNDRARFSARIPPA